MQTNFGFFVVYTVTVYDIQYLLLLFFRDEILQFVKYEDARL